jgi:hypothetical protein
VERVLKKCASEVREAWKKGRRGNKQPATDLQECAGNTAGGNVPELPNTTCMVVIHRVPNGNNVLTSRMQFQVSYTGVRHWEEVIDFIDNDCGPKQPYCLSALSTCH